MSRASWYFIILKVVSSQAEVIAEKKRFLLYWIVEWMNELNLVGWLVQVQIGVFKNKKH